MRRAIVSEGAGQLRYEIREIVAVARELEKLGVRIIYENIGDPIRKGEQLPEWIKTIVTDLAATNDSYRYTDTQGEIPTREFLAAEVNKRNGCVVDRDDIIFFNGLGDAVAKIFGFLRREARVIGPSPAYSTLSSAEASHSGYEHLTYKLDPENRWMPDMDDLENKIRYNPSIAGILLINPDNPTGAVYPRSVLKQFVRLAGEYDLFIACDETYAHVVYDEADKIHLSEVVGDIPAMSLRSISKEYPWPGARCGWLEVFNQHRDPEFAKYIRSLIDAKRLEVCSTTLPQLSIPLVFGDEKYPEHLRRRNAEFSRRADQACEILERVPGITVNKPRGAFYITVLFDAGLLDQTQRLELADPAVRDYIERIVEGVPPDKRFVYYLLGSTGICVVPLSGFCCDDPGFRITLLETDDELRTHTFAMVAEAIRSYTQ